MTKEPRIAKRFEAMAIDLQTYVSYFVPTGLGERIRDSFHSPLIAKSDAEVFLKSFEEGTLEQTLNEHEFEIYHNPNIQEAVVDYFSKGLYKKHIKDNSTT